MAVACCRCSRSRAVPFRVPIAIGGSTANLLVPLYVVVAAGALAYAVPRIARGRQRASRAAGPGLLEWALAAFLALYAVQASYSIDFDRALENVVFFYVPFALLFVLVSRIAWTRRADASRAWACSSRSRSRSPGSASSSTRRATCSSTRRSSPPTSSQDYFRVNSLFFDPNIYGRFLAIVMVAARRVADLGARARATRSPARSSSRSCGAGSC